MSSKQTRDDSSTANDMSETKNDPTTITKPALRRLLYKAGVVRVSSPVYDELRFMTREVLTTIIDESITFMRAENRKTLSYDDVCNSLELRGITVAYAPNHPAKKRASVKSDDAKDEPSEDHPTEEKPADAKKKEQKTAPKKQHTAGVKRHRFRAGIVALRQIRREQKKVGFSIPPTPFARMVAEICHEIEPNMRVSREARMVLQHVIESYIIMLCRTAQNLALHAKRQAIHAVDIQLVRMCCHAKLVASME